RHHQLQVHLGQKMCKILGDHLYSSRVRCILGTDVTANPHKVTPRTQICAVAVGLDNVIHLPDEVRDKVRKATAKGAGGISETGHKLKVGELEFEAMMRHLDNM
ncbi:nervous system adducin, partial [Apostichopus japonicus]